MNLIDFHYQVASQTTDEDKKKYLKKMRLSELVSFCFWWISTSRYTPVGSNYTTKRNWTLLMRMVRIWVVYVVIKKCRMIIMIGGVPCSGKSTLTRNIIKGLGSQQRMSNLFLYLHLKDMMIF